MKTLGRILIILLAALLVSGAAWAFVQNGGAQNLVFEHSRESRPEFGNFPPPEGARPEGDGGHGREGRGEGGVFGLSQLFKNTLIVGGLVVVVAGVSQVGAWARKQWPRKAR